MLKWRKRCFRCLQYLRDDGTCQNPKCVRYTPEKAAKRLVRNDSSTGADAKEKAN